MRSADEPAEPSHPFFRSHNQQILGHEGYYTFGRLCAWGSACRRGLSRLTWRMEIAHPKIDIESCSTWLEIDLAALKNNIRQLRHISKTEIMPVVKANAYGHGLLEVSRAAEEEGVTWLVSPDRGGYLPSECRHPLRFYPGDIPPTQDTGGDRERCDRDAYDPCVAAQYNEAANGMGNPLRVHVKLIQAWAGWGSPPLKRKGSWNN